ncbi:hypothetical protein LCGC14_2430980, partial [marine sediment metagenome]
LQDVVITEMRLKTGNASPTTVYTNNTTATTMHMASRWTKEFWIGGAPSGITIDHNMTYLMSTEIIPNFDPAKSISEATTATDYTGWTASAKNLYDLAGWNADMAQAGGQWYVSPMNGSVVKYLYTFDNRYRENLLGHADLFASYPFHFREGTTGKKFDRAALVDAMGKIFSVNARPSEFFSYANGSLTIPTVGTTSDGGWLVDGAHQPDAHFVPYLLTGDFWYLEEMQYFASWGAGNTAAAIRGPNGYNGHIAGQIRAQAWMFRNRMNAAFLSPDGTDEKTYFELLVDECIAAWEGRMALTGSSFEGNTMWGWADTAAAPSLTINGLRTPPLRHWTTGETGFVQEPMDAAVVAEASSPWEENFLLWSLARGKEFGYATNTLVTWFAQHTINQVNQGGNWDPWFSGAYRIPVQQVSDGFYFTTWDALATGYQAGDYEASWNNDILESEGGFPFITLAAVGMVANEPGGTAAWNWVSARALNAAALLQNPKWALAPRSLEAGVDFALSPDAILAQTNLSGAVANI